MNDVGLTIFAKERRNRTGEDWNIGEQLVSRNLVRRSSGDVVHPKARFHVDNIGFTNVRAAGIDIDLVAEPRESAGKFSNIDVHSPTVASPGLSKGRGVIREYGEPGHCKSLPARSGFGTRALHIGRLGHDDVRHISSWYVPKVSRISRSLGIISPEL